MSRGSRTPRRRHHVREGVEEAATFAERRGRRRARREVEQALVDRDTGADRPTVSELMEHVW